MSTNAHSDQVVVVGAGIVGLATARALAAGGRRVTVLDKESQVGRHQSGHNSGVLHAGLYYRPGSAKARLCAAGRAEMEEYGRARGVPSERCGKVVVATNVDELDRLADLKDRGTRNGLAIQWLDRRGLAEVEPHADGVAALFVAATGVIDFRAVCVELRDDLGRSGVDLRLSSAVERIDETSDRVRVHTTDGSITASAVVNCAGLQADRVARSAGLQPEVVIVPFRGEYLEVSPDAPIWCATSSTRCPTRGSRSSACTCLGVWTASSTPVPTRCWLWLARAIARATCAPPMCERWRATLECGASPRRYWRTGAVEIARSVSRRLMTRQVQRLVPDLRRDDLQPSGSGVRAQAIARDGTLVDDFALIETPRMVHVLNAPSPGATASLALGRWIASRLDADSIGTE